MPQAASHLVAVGLAGAAAVLYVIAGLAVALGSGWAVAIAAAAAIVGLALKVLYFNPWLTLGILLDAAVLSAALLSWPVGLARVTSQRHDGGRPVTGVQRADGAYVPKYLRVYLLDDHDIVRQGLRDLLVPAIDIYVVGDSGSAREATRVIPELRIDVMVLDLRLQDGTGIDVCRAARAADPSVCGLLLTSSGDDEALTAAILAGAAGYVVKLTRSSDITEAIRRVGAGKSLIDRDTLERVSRQLLAAIDELRPRLNEGEQQVLAGVIEGQTDAQIAERTGASLDATTAQVTALIARLTAPMSIQPGMPRGAQAGKHRRSGT